MPLLALLAGILACSTSVLWIKLSTVDPVLLTGLRLTIAVVVLAPWAIRDWRRHRAELNWTHLRDSAVPGVVLALHFVCWIYGARMTLASNGSLIVNLTPIATPFLLAVLSNERITPRETVATLLAACGLGVLFVADYRLSSETLLGDLVCLLAMVLVATYLVLGRRFRHHPTTLLYIVPLYAIAAVVAFAIAPFTAGEAPEDWLAEAPWILLLALLPTIVGHSLLNRAMRSLRGQVVSVMNLSQFVFAGVLAWLFLQEEPEPAFYFAAVMSIAAAMIATSGGQPQPVGDPDAEFDVD